MISRILIKHLTGSKAHQIEQFRLEDTHELLIGRGATADIAYDGELEDSVSRRHAIIKFTRGTRLSLSIADIGSRNGVWLNGGHIQGEQVFLPGDVVRLSPAGPAFTVALEPDVFPIGDEAIVTWRDKTTARRKLCFGQDRAAILVSVVIVGLSAGVVLALSMRRQERPVAAAGVTAAETQKMALQSAAPSSADAKRMRVPATCTPANPSGC